MSEKKSMMENKEIQKHLKTIQKIEKDPALVQPASICEELINKYMINYLREEKIFDREDMRTWELTHLELSYKSKLLVITTTFIYLCVDILEIDNLLGMDQL